LLFALILASGHLADALNVFCFAALPYPKTVSRFSAGDLAVKKSAPETRAAV